LYVSEMLTARALVEGNERTARMLRFDDDERPRSAQLYGVAPGTVGEATRRLIGDFGVEHVDLNFGCPAPKVTAKGGAAALPGRRRRLGNGDIWEAHDALRMMADTECDGVVIGRGCLGRPWLFADLAAVFAGRPAAAPPAFGGVARVMLRHAELLAEDEGEAAGLCAFR